MSPQISALLMKDVRQFITSGSASEQVPAKSVFSGLLVRALRGAGDLDRDGYVTGTELGMYLQREVTALKVGQTPQYGKIRDPDFNEGDFVFAAPMPAPTIAESDVGNSPGAEGVIQRLTRFTRPINYLGLPSLAIPSGFTKAGLPVGMQLIGRSFDEATILTIGAAFQRATDFHQKVPAL